MLALSHRRASAGCALAALIAIVAILAAVRTSEASAAIRWNDGGYARSVAACKNNSPSKLDMAFYANTTGVMYRMNMLVRTSGSFQYDQWMGWSAWKELPKGYSYDIGGSGFAAARIVFAIEWGRRASNGTILSNSRATENVPVFQYPDGYADMTAIINGTPPANIECQLGPAQLIIGHA